MKQSQFNYEILPLMKSSYRVTILSDFCEMFSEV